MPGFAPTAVAGRPHDQVRGRSRSPSASAASAASTDSRKFLREEAIDAVVDATHPYADQMSAQCRRRLRARPACRCASLRAPRWRPEAGDRWQVVANAEAAAEALGRGAAAGLSEPRPPGAAAPSPRAPQHHYLARLIERARPDALPPDLRLMQARGPFDRADEERLLRERAASTCMVSKNSGGAATYAKIEAARELGLPVVMIARPHKPAGNRHRTDVGRPGRLASRPSGSRAACRPSGRPARDACCAPTITSVRMSASAASASPSVVAIDLRLGAAGSADEQHGRLAGLHRAQQLERLAELMRPRLRGGIVERDHEVGLGRGPQAPLDGRPRL